MGSLLREMTDEYQEYLRDESHTVGWAEQIAFPRTEEEVRQVLHIMEGHRFLLGADCTLPTEIAYDRIRTAVEAVK